MSTAFWKVYGTYGVFFLGLGIVSLYAGLSSPDKTIFGVSIKLWASIFWFSGAIYYLWKAYQEYH